VVSDTCEDARAGSHSVVVVVACADVEGDDACSLGHLSTCMK
jgi:hypothetical protein